MILGVMVLKHDKGKLEGDKRREIMPDVKMIEGMSLILV